MNEYLNEVYEAVLNGDMGGTGEKVQVAIDVDPVFLM